MIQATIDTSVLAPSVRRIHTPEHQLAPILRAWRARQFEMVLSAHILEELQRTLSSPYFARRLSNHDIAVAVLGFQTFATIIEITVTVEGVATHPEDDLILATAVSGQVDYLVTLDQQLLRLGSYSSVQIVSPQAFLTILRTES